MASLNDFEAKGVLLEAEDREDLDELISRIPETGTMHIAILQAPYLDLIAKGLKTIESRFTKRKVTPYGRIAAQDLVLLKNVGQPITHYFFVDDFRTIDLSQTPIEEVRRKYADGICAQDEDDFWLIKAPSRYATLVEIGEHGSLPPVLVDKKDQRAWVTFSRRAVLR